MGEVEEEEEVVVLVEGTEAIMKIAVEAMEPILELYPWWDFTIFLLSFLLSRVTFRKVWKRNDTFFFF